MINTFTAIDTTNRSLYPAPTNAATNFGNQLKGAFAIITNELNLISTHADATYYVDVTLGDDANLGTSAGAGNAFKTIAHAIGLIPQIVNHTVTINVAEGDYSAEGTLSILGFSGNGTLTINGGTSLALAVNFIISKLIVNNNSIPTVIKGLNINSAATTVLVTACQRVRFIYCYMDTAATYGFYVDSSMVHIYGSHISNKTIAIQGYYMATILSENNEGTGNTGVLYAREASTIGYNGTQPSGVTATAWTEGGIVRE